mmetsp:Transcript_58513/g.119037  ORF Transcript_58513/g.119037 Transcript_58513/m.119037 type:complete len:496 (+) Transcript_58513:428-1915(+)
MLWIIEHRSEFPERLCRAIERAGGLSSPLGVRLCPEIFLSEIETGFVEWIYEETSVAGNTGATTMDTDADDGIACSVSLSSSPHRGLDDRFDTREQIELALRTFPSVLATREFGMYPIFWLSRSLRSVSFVPIFAQLGMESGLFEDYERGGLVFGGNGLNIFCQLATSSTVVANATTTTATRIAETEELIDDRFVRVIHELHERNLMKRTDVSEENNLLEILLHNQTIVPEQRFRYLVDWDPSHTLLNKNGKCLSWDLFARCRHWSSSSKNKTNNNNDDHDTAAFEVLVELAVKHFPEETGYLFHKYYVRRRNCSTSSDNTSGDDLFPTRRIRGKDSVMVQGGKTTRISTTSPVSSVSAPGNIGASHASASTSSATRTNTVASTCTRSTTPYRLACKRFGIEKVDAILKRVLDTCFEAANDRPCSLEHHNCGESRWNGSLEPRFASKSATAAGTTTVPSTTTAADSLVHAASEPQMDLDCVYLWLQRDPTICKPC